MIKIFIIMFVVIFDYDNGEQRSMQLEFENVEQCF